MSRPALVFVTYYRLVPTAQIGVFKRAIRLLHGLAGEFDLHLINFGPAPENEPELAALGDRLTLHRGPEHDVGEEVTRILREADPIAVVHAETPIRGSMRTAHHAATRLGLWQVAIADYFGDVISPILLDQWPSIDRWLLLGLTADGSAEIRTPMISVVPPLVRAPARDGRPRDRITVFGYDERTLRIALRLLELLPHDGPVDLFTVPKWRELATGLPDRVRIIELPDDATIYDSLSRARLVCGKGGYQQIAEALMLGAPVIGRRCGGGVTEAMLLPALRERMRLVRSELDLPALLPELERWLAEPPASLWTAADTIPLATRRLRELLERGPRTHPTSELHDIYRLASLIAHKDWAELETLLREATIWMFDHAQSPAELLAMLRDLLGDAETIRLITLVPTKEEPKHLSATSCLQWDERGSWTEHDLELDLHAGWREDGSLAYLGATAPTRHEA